MNVIKVLLSYLTGILLLRLVSVLIVCLIVTLFPFVSFRSPSLFYLLTVGVEFVYFHLITLRHTPQSVGLLWTRDRPVAETST
jgi:hypothetical protein